jgi:hypothetical protein
LTPLGDFRRATGAVTDTTGPRSHWMAAITQLLTGGRQSGTRY